MVVVPSTRGGGYAGEYFVSGVELTCYITRVAGWRGGDSSILSITKYAENKCLVYLLKCTMIDQAQGLAFKSQVY